MNIIWVLTAADMCNPKDIVTWDESGAPVYDIAKAVVHSSIECAHNEAKTFAGGWMYNLKHDHIMPPHATIWLGPPCDHIDNFKPRMRETCMSGADKLVRTCTDKERGLYFDPPRVWNNLQQSPTNS